MHALTSVECLLSWAPRSGYSALHQNIRPAWVAGRLAAQVTSATQILHARTLILAENSKADGSPCKRMTPAPRTRQSIHGYIINILSPPPPPPCVRYGKYSTVGICVNAGFKGCAWASVTLLWCSSRPAASKRSSLSAGNNIRNPPYIRGDCATSQLKGSCNRNADLRLS
jgi:hypothetical protein